MSGSVITCGNRRKSGCNVNFVASRSRHSAKKQNENCSPVDFSFFQWEFPPYAVCRVWRKWMVSLQHFSPSRLHLWGMCLALNFTENVTSEKQGMSFFCKCPRVCDERKIKGEVGRNPVDIAKAWVHKTWGRGRVFLRRSEAATLFFAKTFLHGISRGFSDLLLDTRTCILQLIEGEKMSRHQVRFSTLATPRNLGLGA